ncbi:MAG: hypothetical protein ABI220_04870 [Candidatus Saccharimonadales bacterium]
MDPQEQNYQPQQPVQPTQAPQVGGSIIPPASVQVSAAVPQPIINGTPIAPQQTTTKPDDEDKDARKRKLVLLIAGGAALLVIIIVIVVVAFTSGSEPTKKTSQKSNNSQQSSPLPATYLSQQQDIDAINQNMSLLNDTNDFPSGALDDNSLSGN